MARVKRGVTAGRRHKKVLKKAKGYYNARRKVYRVAKQAVIKAGQYAYTGRRLKKRDYRALWIQRINAAARGFGLSYSTFKLEGLELPPRVGRDGTFTVRATCSASSGWARTCCGIRSNCCPASAMRSRRSPTTSRSC